MARWVPTAADRDAQGRIITDPLGHRSLAELLPPTPPPDGERPAASPADAPPPTLRARVTHALLALGVVVGLSLVIVGSHGAPAAVPSRIAPTIAPAPPTSTPAPTRAPTPTMAPTGTPTPEPPTPIVIVQQAPPVQCYSVTLDVADEHGTPIGIATGESCDSREAAQANAEAEAAQVRATHERR